VDNCTVIVLATCTDAGLLDRALLRPGRLEHHIPLTVPDAEARVALLTYFLQGTPLEHTAAAALQAEDTRLSPTASVADIKGLANQLIFSHVTRTIQHGS
jgi:transitional endoplasmic reticulum ATPase